MAGIASAAVAAAGAVTVIVTALDAFAASGISRESNWPRIEVT
jgi:hypothetical protein